MLKYTLDYKLGMLANVLLIKENMQRNKKINNEKKKQEGKLGKGVTLERKGWWNMGSTQNWQYQVSEFALCL